MRDLLLTHSETLDRWAGPLLALVTGAVMGWLA